MVSNNAKLRTIEQYREFFGMVTIKLRKDVKGSVKLVNQKIAFKKGTAEITCHMGLRIICLFVSFSH